MRCSQHALNPDQTVSDRCPYGRNGYNECCEANRQYTDDNGNKQECCILGVVNCAKKLLKGQKSVHWPNNDRKRRGAPTDIPIGRIKNLLQEQNSIHWSNGN